MARRAWRAGLGYSVLQQGGLVAGSAGNLMKNLAIVRAAAKFAAFEDAGVHISRSPATLGETMIKAFKAAGKL